MWWTIIVPYRVCDICTRCFLRVVFIRVLYFMTFYRYIWTIDYVKGFVEAYPYFWQPSRLKSINQNILYVIVMQLCSIILIHIKIEWKYSLIIYNFNMLTLKTVDWLLFSLIDNQLNADVLILAAQLSLVQLIFAVFPVLFIMAYCTFLIY